MFELRVGTKHQAGKVGLELEVTKAGENTEIWIWEENENDEPLIRFMVNLATGGFSYVANIYLAEEKRIELPATIRDEKHLIEVCRFIAA